MLTVTLLEEAFHGTLGTQKAVGPETSAAAVSAIFRDAPIGLEVLLIRRAERAGDPWSGHMAFPGGRRDPSDRDLLATSLRETLEEIGLDLSKHASVLGALQDQSAGTRRAKLDMPIRPFIFRLDSDGVAFTPNEEVTEVVWAPVKPMMAGERKSSIEVDYENVHYTLPAFDLDGRIVWGLTYRMLEQIFSRLRGVLSAG
jgi:8-oxo-dGTP pyrophosphatase MutT (NUDIX family)